MDNQDTNDIAMDNQNLKNIGNIDTNSIVSRENRSNWYASHSQGSGVNANINGLGSLSHENLERKNVVDPGSPDTEAIVTSPLSCDIHDMFNTYWNTDDSILQAKSSSPDDGQTFEWPGDDIQSPDDLADFKKKVMNDDQVNEARPTGNLMRRKSSKRPKSFEQSHVLITAHSEASQLLESLKELGEEESKLEQNEEFNTTLNAGALKRRAAHRKKVTSEVVGSPSLTESIEYGSSILTESTEHDGGSIETVEYGSSNLTESTEHDGDSPVSTPQVSNTSDIEHPIIPAIIERERLPRESPLRESTDVLPAKKSKKKKWGWFSRLFDAPKRQVDDDDDWNPYPKDFEPLPARLPLEQEKVIYALSHIKLAQIGRPLEHQVLISNLMLYILSVHSDVTLRGRGPKTRRKKKIKKKIPPRMQQPLIKPKESDSESESSSSEEDSPDDDIPLGMLPIAKKADEDADLGESSTLES